MLCESGRLSWWQLAGCWRGCVDYLCLILLVLAQSILSWFCSTLLGHTGLGGRRCAQLTTIAELAGLNFGACCAAADHYDCCVSMCETPLYGVATSGSVCDLATCWRLGTLRSVACIVNLKKTSVCKLEHDTIGMLHQVIISLPVRLALLCKCANLGPQLENHGWRILPFLSSEARCCIWPVSCSAQCFIWTKLPCV